MQPHDAPTWKPHKSAFARYAAALIFLVAVVGGIAWIAQYLPNWKKGPTVPVSANKSLLEFSAFKINDVVFARWNQGPPQPMEFEIGKKGHYDFSFKNVADVDVEVVFFTSTCDCASLQACALPADEWERVDTDLRKYPGEPPQYSIKPTWVKLVKWQEWTKLASEEQHKSRVLVKPGEGGVVRVEWHANKPVGQKLEVQPIVGFQPVGDASQIHGQKLAVPLTTVQPIQVFPRRASVGLLAAGSKSRAEFDVWSSTRAEFDLGLVLPHADPLFVVESRPLQAGGLFSRSECTALERRLASTKINTRVLSAYHVTVTVHEAKGERQLDQGSFYRKFALELDGRREVGLPEVEVIGGVTGDIKIGGADDRGRIRFQSFSARDGADKPVELEADAKVELIVHKWGPSWIETPTLTRTETMRTPGRRIWLLRVSVNPGAPGARSFDEPDAVVLRIVGPPERFLRIPIEGNVTGR